MTSAHSLICQQCQSEFLLTEAEQLFRETRGLDAPALCPTCRDRERSFRNADLITLYEKTETFDPFLLGKETQAGAVGSARGQRGARLTFTATCSQCGAETRVPFQPRGDRPVYCRSCYNARRGR